MNFFNKLVEETKKERELLYSAPFVVAGLQGKLNKEEYIAYLTEAYHHVKHTVPLLMACGSRISHESEWLRLAIIDYIKEEVGHQEWILSDIRNTGGDARAVEFGKPLPATEIMVSYIYDSVTRINPLCLFGMAFVLESTSTQLATDAAIKLQQTLKLDNNCFSYLLSHGSLDIKHMSFFSELVNKFHDEKEQELIIHMSQIVFRLFADVFKSLPLASEVKNATGK